MAAFARKTIKQVWMVFVTFTVDRQEDIWYNYIDNIGEIEKL